MHLIGRRNFLAGLGLGAGSHLLGALFRTMLPEALGQAQLRKRWLGYIPMFGQAAPYLPKQGPDGGLVLTGACAGFEPYKSEILYIDSTYNNLGWELHHPYSPLCLIESTLDEDQTPGDLSFDRMLAQKIGGGDPFSSVNIAPIWVPTWRGVSADGPGKPVPHEGDPMKAYERFFGGRAVSAAGGPPLADRISRQQGLLDILKEDIARMNARLGAPERAKMDQYTESIKSFEKRLASLAQQASAGSPAACGALPSAPAQPAGRVVDPKRIEAQCELGVLTLACGLTKVANLAMTWAAHTWIGPTVGVHNWFHTGLGSSGEKPDFLTYHTYHNNRVAQIRKRLGEFPEGNGTLADSTLIMYHNIAGLQHHAPVGKREVLWFLLIGSLGGHFKTGRYVQLPRGKHFIGDAFVSIANAVGADIKAFGTRPELCTGGLPGLT
jgi:hypothetical protein